MFGFKRKFVLLSENDIALAVEAMSTGEGSIALGKNLQFFGGGESPEQYYLRANGHEISYLRLRGGYFYADVLNFLGVEGDLLVYVASADGFVSTKYHPQTGWKGCQYSPVPVKGRGKFDEAERPFFLKEALTKVSAFYANWETRLVELTSQTSPDEVFKQLVAYMTASTKTDRSN